MCVCMYMCEHVCARACFGLRKNNLFGEKLSLTMKK